MTSKTRRTLLALGTWPESRPITRTLRNHWEDATAKKSNGVFEFRIDGRVVYRWSVYGAEPAPEQLYECRIVLDDKPAPEKTAAEIRNLMMGR